MICALLAAGKRVGITGHQPQGHRQPPRRGPQAAADDDGPADRARSSAATPTPSSTTRASPRAKDAKAVQDRLDRRAWRTSPPGRRGCGRRRRMADAVDVLFVDEAGQISLANVVAMAARDRQHRPARRSAAARPAAAGHRTRRVPTGPRWPTSSASRRHDAADRGLFLETTWRLHPDLCDYTSEVFYDDRLEPEAHLAVQRPGEPRIRGSTGSGRGSLAVADRPARTTRIAGRGRGRGRARSLAWSKAARRWIDAAWRSRDRSTGTTSSSSRRTTPRSGRSSGCCRPRPGSGPSTSSRARRRRSASTR